MLIQIFRFPFRLLDVHSDRHAGVHVSCRLHRHRKTCSARAKYKLARVQDCTWIVLRGCAQHLYILSVCKRGHNRSTWVRAGCPLQLCTISGSPMDDAASASSVVTAIGVIVAGLIVLRVKACHTCKHGSNTVNPVIFGALAKHLCLPWLYGDHQNPGGDFCQICYAAFRHAGFLHEFGTLRTFRNALKKDTSLIDQFLAARGLLTEHITLVSLCELPYRPFPVFDHEPSLSIFACAHTTHQCQGCLHASI
jgi:hypothetical protein